MSKETISAKVKELRELRQMQEELSGMIEAIQDEIKAIYEQYPNVYGVFDTERTAALNMYLQSGQTLVKRLIVFRDRPPLRKGKRDALRRVPGVFMQLNPRNRDMEILVDYESRETVRLGTLLPDWWGMVRYETDQGKEAAE